MLRFNSLSKKPKHFLNFTGLTINEFNKLISHIEDDWQLQRKQRLKPIEDRQRKLGGGRKLKLSELKDRVLVFTVYAKLYSSYLLLEYLFNVDESNICRIIQEIAPLLSKRIVINRRGKKITTLEELKKVIPDLDEILVDTTEQKIPRPKKKRARKKYHSGKKKSHTLKTQIITNRKGLILYASDSSPGRPHDYNYFKRTKVPKWLEKNPNIRSYADSGYQGVNKDYPKANFTIPIKRTRSKKELTRSEKIRNTKLSKKRIIIEHTFANLKKYKILKEVYRNSKEHYSEIFKSIAFLSNLRMLERNLA